MSEKSGTAVDEESAAACGVDGQGLKCAVVSWVMPLAAVLVLIAGQHYPVVSVFNILFVAFGITALVRSGAHMRMYGSCGLGGHLAVGAVLNLAIIMLVVIYIFTGHDPMHIRP
jgi:hypothetical protein